MKNKGKTVKKDKYHNSNIIILVKYYLIVYHWEKV